MLLAVARNHVEVHNPCPPLTEGKEATFAMVLMTADSQLRKRDMKGFCDNPYPHPTAPSKLTA